MGVPVTAGEISHQGFYFPKHIGSCQICCNAKKLFPTRILQVFWFGLDLQTNKQKILTGNNHFCSQGRAEWPGATYDAAKP